MPIAIFISQISEKFIDRDMFTESPILRIPHYPPDAWLQKRRFNISLGSQDLGVSASERYISQLRPSIEGGMEIKALW